MVAYSTVPYHCPQQEDFSKHTFGHSLLETSVACWTPPGLPVRLFTLESPFSHLTCKLLTVTCGCSALPRPRGGPGTQVLLCFFCLDDSSKALKTKLEDLLFCGASLFPLPCKPLCALPLQNVAHWAVLSFVYLVCLPYFTRRQG